MVTTLSRVHENKEWIMQPDKGPEGAKPVKVMGKNRSLSTWKEVKMRATRADEMIKTTGGKTIVQMLLKM